MPKIITSVLLLLYSFVSLSYTNKTYGGLMYKMVKRDKDNYDFSENLNEPKFEDYSQKNMKEKPPTGDTPDEKLMTLKEFYETVHNLEHRRIPNTNLVEISEEHHKIYKTELNNYCLNEYRTFENFAGTYHLGHFQNSINALLKCLSGANDSNSDKRNAKFVENVKECLSDENDSNSDKRNVKFGENVKECLSDANDSNSDKHEHVTNRRPKRINSNSDPVTQKISCLKEKLEKDYGKFETCMNKFVDEMFKIEAKADKNIAENDLTLVYTIIVNDGNIEAVTDMYENYKNMRFQDEKEKGITFCKDNIKPMSLLDYTSTKLKFIIFPNGSQDVDNLYDYYIYMKILIENIQFKDKENDNKPFYKSLIEHIKHIKAQDVINMKSRRVFSLEEDYESYMIRLQTTDYFPLTKKTWEKERNNYENNYKNIEAEKKKSEE